MKQAEVLEALREMVAACEAAGWDGDDANRAILDRGREAFRALETVMADADEAGEP
jgi:hypothetical protein